jgi:hypothetical protein
MAMGCDGRGAAAMILVNMMLIVVWLWEHWAQWAATAMEHNGWGVKWHWAQWQRTNLVKAAIVGWQSQGCPSHIGGGDGVE